MIVLISLKVLRLLYNIDEIIELIRRAPTPAEAKAIDSSRLGLGNVAAMLERVGTDAARLTGWSLSLVFVIISTF